jgi:integrase
MRTPTAYTSGSGKTRYKVRFRLGKLQTSETFDTLVEAEKFAQLLTMIGPADALAYLQRHYDAADPSQKFGAWAETYLKGLTGIEPGTRFGYQRLLENHCGSLRSMPLDSIGRPAIAHIINTMQAKGLSAKTIANVHGLLSACFAEAAAQGRIPRNPCRGMRLPRAGEQNRGEAWFLTVEERDRLLDAIPDHYYPLVMTLLGTGLRWSEATALQIRHVTLDGRLPAIRVRQAWKRVPGHGFEIGPPKSSRSRRTVILGAEVIEVLAPLVEGQEPDEFVFRTDYLKRSVSRSNFYNRIWRPAIKQARLDGLRIHDLRHTHASTLIENGITLEVVQERLGHESIETTRRIYGHLRPDAQLEAARAASLAFSHIRQIES